jgi:hypothetical protein
MRSLCATYDLRLRCTRLKANPKTIPIAAPYARIPNAAPIPIPITIQIAIDIPLPLFWDLHDSDFSLVFSASFILLSPSHNIFNGRYVNTEMKLPIAAELRGIS